MEKYGSDTLNMMMGLALAGALKYTALAWLRKSVIRRFEYIGRVSSILLYPVKGGRAMSVSTAYCTELGLQVDGVIDRHWVITRLKNGARKAVTQTDFPSLALLETDISGGELHLNVPGMPTFTLPVNPCRKNMPVVECNVYTGVLHALDCGDEASKWISTYLDSEDVRIWYIDPELNDRDVSLTQSAWNESPASHACKATYMLSNKASLEDLNKRTCKETDMVNFRPNIVIEGAQAYDEDNWLQLMIGATMMRCVDTCLRCSIITIDPKTGKYPKDGEPLKTLKTYRISDVCTTPPKAKFGIYTCLDKGGYISTGHPVFAIRK